MSDRAPDDLDSTLRARWPERLADHTDLTDRLLAAYAEPHRGYHDRRHLAEVLDRLATLCDAEPAAPRAGTDEADALVLAAWFHDAVYDGRADAEDRSAALAADHLAACDLPRGLVAEVVRLVRLTATHDPGADDVAGRLLCDADLAILAADEQRYAEYTAGVRREYAHVPDDAFRTGRAAVLRTLAGRPALFHSRHARAHWEQPARANLARELRLLEGGGPR